MTRMTRIFKAALYIPAYYTEGKKNPRHPCHPCLKDYLHAEGEPCSSATLVNYHLQNSINNEVLQSITNGLSPVILQGIRFRTG